MTFSKEECRQILKPVLDVSLPNMRICRNYPRAAVHRPSDEGGLDIDDLYTYQETSKIALLQEHINAKTITGELIRASIEMAKIEIGIGRNLFELDYSKYSSLLTESWITSIWEFAHTNKITIHDKITKIYTSNEKTIYSSWNNSLNSTSQKVNYHTLTDAEYIFK